jgi:hypothetical protein
MTPVRRFRRSTTIRDVDNVVVTSRPVRRILYRVAPVMAIPLGRRLPAGSCGLPEGLTGGPPFPLLGLAPGGVCRAAGVTPSAGALLPHRFTLTCAALHPGVGEPPSAVCSLWHFPAGHPDWALPSALPCGVRTFLGRVTSRARTRPSGRLATSAIVAAPGGPCRRRPLNSVPCPADCGWNGTPAARRPTPGGCAHGIHQVAGGRPL